MAQTEDRRRITVRLMVLQGIRHLPVVEDGNLMGVISMRDIVLELAWAQAVIEESA